MTDITKSYTALSFFFLILPCLYVITNEASNIQFRKIKISGDVSGKVGNVTWDEK